MYESLQRPILVPSASVSSSRAICESLPGLISVTRASSSTVRECVRVYERLRETTSVYERCTRVCQDLFLLHGPLGALYERVRESTSVFEHCARELQCRNSFELRLRGAGWATKVDEPPLNGSQRPQLISMTEFEGSSWTRAVGLVISQSHCFNNILYLTCLCNRSRWR